MRKILFLICFVILFAFTVYGEESLLEVKHQLERINRDITDLQKEIYKNKSAHISENNNQDSSQITVFDMRLRDIENELKVINFNYENLVFEIDDLQNEINELSIFFEELSIKLSNAIINKENLVENNVVVDSQPKQEPKQNEKNSLGNLVISSEDLSETINNSSESEKKEIINLSLEEEFQVALDLLRSQKFDEAKSALKIFIENYPSNNLSGSAHYWLGEIFLLKKENREAALVFAEGYQNYPENVKAPDTLYKFAEALLKIEKKNEACDAMNQFIAKYPAHQLIEKIKSKINAIQCN